MIYLDNAATTQPTKAVLEVYQQAQQQLFFNSESLHIGGEQVRAALDHSRSYLQRYFQTNKEVLFSTSGSHANAIAINLYLSHFTSGTVWVSPYEHPSIHAALDPYKAQFDIKRLPLTVNGEIDVTQFEAAMTTDVVLIIMQHVNSETGYILPIQAIGRIAKNWEVPLHVDGVQAVHKMPHYTIEGCTSYSCAGHKFHGVKGTGMLFVDYAWVHPYNDHYFHEEGVRNGTLDVPGILASVQALTATPPHTELQECHQHAVRRAKALDFDLLLYDHQAPHILGLLTPKYEGQYLMQTLSNRNICISTGTACGHGILVSDGAKQKIESLNGEVYQYMRLSFSALTTIEEIDRCFDTLATVLKEGGNQ
ncbi:cysteine desulfurase family protein [Staphylococcus sp. 11261D007BR]